MKKFITNKITLTIFGIILFLMLWWMISALVGHGSRIFPDPWSTIAYTAELVIKPSTYYHLGWSFLRMLAGFLLGAVFGIIFGIFVGNYQKAKHVFEPTVIALKAVPTAALVYLFLVLIGAKNAPIFIVALITAPIIYEAVIGGYSNIDANILNSLKLDDRNRIYSNIVVKFPLATPYLLVGMVSSFALSLKIEIMAEVISGSTSYGIGNIIKAKQQEDPSDLVPIFAYALIAIIAILIITLLLSLLKKKLNLDDLKKA